MKNYVNCIKKGSYILLLFTFLISAQKSSSQNHNPKPYLLWKVSGNDLETPSYILGVNNTYNATEILPDLEQILSVTEQLILDAKKENTPEEAARLQQLIIDPTGGTSFYAQFDSITKKQLDTFFIANYGANFKRISVYKPFMIRNLIAGKIVNQYDITAKLTDFSKKQNQAIIGLETLEEQINEFDKIPIAEQVTGIVEMISDLDAAKEKFASISKYYTMQNINGIYKELKEFESSDTGKIMLASRNQKWLPQLIGLMQQKSSFIAIGLTHMLPFKNNLKELLETSGYTVALVK